MASKGMSAEDASAQAASDVVDDYAKKKSNGNANGRGQDQYNAMPVPGRPQSLAPIDHAEETW